MRILYVRFKNLNSLVGEWKIEFTHPAYQSSGIFAITGPTGAGKTTIFDAICLALYGQTPRLDKISKSTNEIMSRHTGECFAEVAFETAKGHFRSYWSQRRSRKKSNGELQSQKHEIVNADNGDILENKISNMSQAVQDVTGMDFPQFTRSMLLAQGDFAAFLQAKPDERSPILEQITGTEIYSRISIKTHERKSAEDGKLEMMQSELKGIQLLSDEEETQLSNELTDKGHKENERKQKVDAIGKALIWLDNIKVLEEEKVSIEEAWREFEKRKIEAQPELTRLERAQKALALAGAYAQVTEVRSQQKKEESELAGTSDKLPKMQEQHAVAVTRQEQAVAAYNNICGKQQADAEIIKIVRGLDININTARLQIEEFSKTIHRFEDDCKTHLMGIEGIDAKLFLQIKTLEDIQLYLTEHSVDGRLIENLTGIEQQFNTLKNSDKEHKQKLAQLNQAAADIEITGKILKEKENELKTAKENAEQAERRIKELSNRLDPLLAGREISVWRDEKEALLERRRQLEKTKEALEQIEKNNIISAQLKQQCDASNSNLITLEGQQTALSKEQELREQIVRQLEEKVDLLKSVRRLDEEREHLCDGKPCPLCGATEHPYAHGNVPQPDAAQNQLEIARQEYTKVTGQFNELMIKQATTAKDLEQAVNKFAENKLLLARDEKECADGLDRLNISVAPVERLTVVNVALSSTEREVKLCSDTVAKAESLIKLEKDAQGLLSKAKENLSQQEQAVKDACHENEKAHELKCRIKSECEELAQKLDGIRKDTLSNIEVYGVHELTSDSVYDILQNLSKRRTLWKNKQEDKDRAGNDIRQLQAEREKQSALLVKLEQELKTKREDYQKQHAKLDELIKQRKESYGDKAPDQEEQRIIHAVKQAETERDKAGIACNRIESEVQILKGKISSLTKSTDERKEKLASQEQSLRTGLVQAGFADEAEYKSACLLQEERDELNNLREKLGHEETEIRTRLKGNLARLEYAQGLKLTEQSREALKAEFDILEAQLKGVREEIGAINRRLTENSRYRQEQKDKLQVIEAQKKECKKWNRLHELIGSADGKKFRNFAQGLTFDIMISHANQQLKKMSDRYLLIRDEAQLLELNVMDNYQAGEIRSVKNLSGGESFIVSLALALGLSGMASRNMRVDSLFLDEGFGTLDEESLETALETLGELQESGKLIGVISHIPALKERITAQIHITPSTCGRSRIDGPGCEALGDGEQAGAVIA